MRKFSRKFVCVCVRKPNTVAFNCFHSKLIMRICIPLISLSCVSVVPSSYRIWFPHTYSLERSKQKKKKKRRIMGKFRWLFIHNIVMSYRIGPSCCKRQSSNRQGKQIFCVCIYDDGWNVRMDNINRLLALWWMVCGNELLWRYTATGATHSPAPTPPKINTKCVWLIK